MSAAAHTPLRSLAAGAYQISSQYSLLQRNFDGKFAIPDTIGWGLRWRSQIDAGVAQVDDPLVDPGFNLVFDDMAVLQIMSRDLMIYAVVRRDACWRLAA
ncbi:hypothetical protein Taro_025435 [Colocasia esculenta]|uniref:Uncharacterized protein n=1 Tax=Colocasia esculenta TaxID=4460 RepID=A0A843VNB0_COLES|nr:hypothetical protein [Colocasia esculenta]